MTTDEYAALIVDQKTASKVVRVSVTRLIDLANQNLIRRMGTGERGGCISYYLPHLVEDLEALQSPEACEAAARRLNRD